MGEEDDSEWGVRDEEDGEWGVRDGDNGAESTGQQADGATDAGDGEDTDDGATLTGILVMLVIGAALLGGGLYLQSQQPSPGSTDTVNATVLESDYTQRGSGSDREFKIDITYEYVVDGETYRSSNVHAGETSYTVDTRQRAERLTTEQYAPNETFEAHVDLDDPETAYIVEYRRGSRIEENIGHYLLMLFGGLAILASVVSLTKKARRAM